ncbi:MAG: hypothetical protein EOP85_17160, partial [Verrucomicrobiaceae bacterium]
MKSHALTIGSSAPAPATDYASMISATPEARKEILKISTGTTSTTGDYKKSTAKVLTAMIIAGDCEESKIRESAEKITGVDIRDIYQGIYELRVVFSALVKKEIDLTEDEFDSIGSSILALLSPFIQKDELKPLLAEAVKLAKSGTAKQIRDLKPKGEVKEPKAVREMREKFEAEAGKTAAAEERAAAAEKRAKDIESRYTVKCAFAITDIEQGDAVLTSDQLRNRIKADINSAYQSKDEDMLVYHHDMLGK